MFFQTAWVRRAEEVPFDVNMREKAVQAHKGREHSRLKKKQGQRP